MPAVIPPLLSPYVSLAPQGSLTLVTSVSNATSNWLLLRYIYAALNGQELTDTEVLVGGVNHRNRENFKVVFVSILRAFEQWREMGKKVGLDFQSLVSSNRLIYINGLTDHTLSPSPSLLNPQVINFNLGNFHELGSLVRRYAERNQGSEDPSKTLLIIDGLDFLLASQPSVANLTLSRMIMSLRQHVYQTIVTSFADYPLLHNSSPGATPLESEHRGFVTTVAHQSWIVVQLRSLGSGAAKDISGVLRVSAGGAYEVTEEENSGFEEGEWLYQVKGDGSVKVWGRGE